MTISLQDSAIGTVDAPYHYVPGLGFAINGHTYVVTPRSYASTREFIGVHQTFGVELANIFGTHAQLADWRDLEADLTSPELVQAFLSGTGLPVETPYGTYPNLFVSNSSQYFQPGSGGLDYYFITNFTGSTSAAVGYGALDSIGPLSSAPIAGPARRWSASMATSPAPPLPAASCQPPTLLSIRTAWAPSPINGGPTAPTSTAPPVWP